MASFESMARSGITVSPMPIARNGSGIPTGEDGAIRGLADAGGMIDSNFEPPMYRKPLEMAGLDAAGQGRSDSGGNAPRRTRTYNPLIKSQLLCQLS